MIIFDEGRKKAARLCESLRRAEISPAEGAIVSVHVQNQFGWLQVGIATTSASEPTPPRALAATLSPNKHLLFSEEHTTWLYCYSTFSCQLKRLFPILHPPAEKDLEPKYQRWGAVTNNLPSHGCLPEVLEHCQGPMAYQMDMSVVIASRCSTHSFDRVEGTMYVTHPAASKQTNKPPKNNTNILMRCDARY